ncbi:hypothetical protein IMZ31_07350 [Pontibacillus sp. ALD_SL1]|uniref:hypothetical protein n=1 Tax=Pontibacillus sp. ALD_SL1 TaxID=2777185 RepID=UPI001A9734E0|nr:hypothetical protein [Pontibacillus sp. ALD_SL1]QST01366.1 hypothetical protein IMZ31_07350 [Pontibacillus sp. ALD_SL1]
MILTEMEIRDLIDKRKPEKVAIHPDPMKYKLKSTSTWIQRCLASALNVLKG